MKFKLDENLGQTALKLFQRAGYDVTTVAQQKMTSAQDTELITACLKEQRCLVTLDQDFSNPLLFKPSSYSGIAVLRLPPRITRNSIELAVETLISALSEEDITGKLWIVSIGQIRIYQEE